MRRSRNPRVIEPEESSPLGPLARLARDRLRGDVDAEHDAAQRARLLAALSGSAVRHASSARALDEELDDDDDGESIDPIVAEARRAMRDKSR